MEGRKVRKLVLIYWCKEKISYRAGEIIRAKNIAEDFIKGYLLKMYRNLTLTQKGVIQCITLE